ncbi:MAG: outer membrane beta-barrel domain-containing protein [Gammaproteobacteria bacterium]|nr:outer membrane beta-barrel domain-containing protein [Gammaproteobacteria bacterium]
MESGIRILLLRVTALMVLAAALPGCGLLGRDDVSVDDPRAADPVISAEVERRRVTRPKIDTENFEITAYGGLLAVEDFGSNSVVGARLAYHISESLFLEGTYAQTGKVDRSSVEVLENISLFPDSDREYSYYDLSIGWNVLPGEVFIGRSRAFNSALYVVAGAGNTDFAGDDRFTLTFGAGYRVLVTDAIGLHFDVRDHLFDIDVTGEDKTTHNIEFGLGLSWFF